jgi:hypothetical protein
MNQELAQMALKFLERITLQPAEIDAFTTVYKALQEYKEPEEVFTETFDIHPTAKKA